MDTFPLILAEVSDKIPGKGAYMVIGIVFLVLVTAFASRESRASLLLEFTLIGIGLFFIVKEYFVDSTMREAILAEQGISYYIIALSSMIIPLLAGIILYVRKERPKEE